MAVDFLLFIWGIYGRSEARGGCGGVIFREGSRGSSAGGTTFLYIPLDGAFTTANGGLAASWLSNLP